MYALFLHGGISQRLRSDGGSSGEGLCCLRLANALLALLDVLDIMHSLGVSYFDLGPILLALAC